MKINRDAKISEELFQKLVAKDSKTYHVNKAYQVFYSHSKNCQQNYIISYSARIVKDSFKFCQHLKMMVKQLIYK